MIPVIYFLCALCWFIPVYRRQGQDEKLHKKWCIAAGLSGAVPAFIVAVAVQIGAGFCFKIFGTPHAAMRVIEAFGAAAFTEELLKLFCAMLIIRLAKPSRKIDYVLIFGAAGLGFSVTESLGGMLTGESVIAAIVTAVTAYHVNWQYWMGMFFYDYRQLKSSGNNSGAAGKLLVAIGVPVLMHGINDWLVFALEDYVKDVESTFEVLILMAMILWTVWMIIYAVITLRKALRIAKDSCG